MQTGNEQKRANDVINIENIGTSTSTEYGDHCSCGHGMILVFTVSPFMLAISIPTVPRHEGTVQSIRGS